jgi:hypothetical protein
MIFVAAAVIDRLLLKCCRLDSGRAPVLLGRAPLLAVATRRNRTALALSVWFGRRPYRRYDKPRSFSLVQPGAMARVTILFVAANPPGTERIFLDQEYRTLENQRRRALHRDAIGLDALWAASPLDLTSKLNESQPAVIHFAGHGTRDGILFVNDLDRYVAVPGTALRALLAECSTTLKLVVLNACYSDDIAREIVEVVGCVIGMPAPIGDHAARVFSEALYAALCAGRSVGSAYHQALVLCGLDCLSVVSRDIDPSSIPAWLQIPVLRTRHDVDPDQLRLFDAGSGPGGWARRRGAVSQRLHRCPQCIAKTPLPSIDWLNSSLS